MTNDIFFTLLKNCTLDLKLDEKHYGLTTLLIHGDFFLYVFIAFYKMSNKLDLEQNGRNYDIWLEESRDSLLKQRKERILSFQKSQGGY